MTQMPCMTQINQKFSVTLCNSNSFQADFKPSNSNCRVFKKSSKWFQTKTALKGFGRIKAYFYFHHCKSSSGDKQCTLHFGSHTKNSTEGAALAGWVSLQILPFQNSLYLPSEPGQAGSEIVWNSPAKWLGITSALAVGVYTFRKTKQPVVFFQYPHTAHNNFWIAH